MKNIQHNSRYTKTYTRLLPLSLLMAIIAFLGFGGNPGEDPLIPFAHADTPHTGDSGSGDGEVGDGCAGSNDCGSCDGGGNGSGGCSSCGNCSAACGNDCGHCAGSGSTL